MKRKQKVEESQSKSCPVLFWSDDASTKCLASASRWKIRFDVCQSKKNIHHKSRGGAKWIYWKSEECNRSLKSDWKEKSDEKLKLRIFEHSLIGGDFDGSRVHYRVQDNSPKECMKTRWEFDKWKEKEENLALKFKTKQKIETNRTTKFPKAKQRPPPWISCGKMVRETRHLWVANLPDNTREDRIREHFQR